MVGFFKNIQKNHKSNISKKISSSLPISILVILFCISNQNFHDAIAYTVDSFDAEGIIFTTIEDNDEGKINILKNLTKDNRTISESNQNSINQPIQNQINLPPTLRGQWDMKVDKGELKEFKTIFTIHDITGKIINAYGIYNLKNTGHIQLDDLGTEVINGVANLKSLGKINSTIPNIDVVIVIEGLSKIKVILDESKLNKQHFQGLPILGKTNKMVDGSGNLLIGPRPPIQPNPPPGETIGPRPPIQPNPPPGETIGPRPPIQPNPPPGETIGPRPPIQPNPPPGETI